MTLLAAVVAVLCLLPAGLLALNLLRFGRPPRPGDRPAPVSVLVPARDEQDNIGPCIESILASRGVDLELLVLDDGSTDATPDIIRHHAAIDGRLRYLRGAALPAGWNGKQHACWQLAHHARHEHLVFLDADVRLAPDALARGVAMLHTSGVSLTSGFPRQVTGAFLERLLIPLIHFVLLAYLPMGLMRRTRWSAFGAGCGQWFITRRDDYLKAGGHAAIRASRHDGITLPRAYRRAGLRTDVFDASTLAACRMYDSSAATWHGLGKNATEAMAGPGAILPWTLLLGAQALAPALAILAWLGGDAVATRLLLAAAAAPIAARLACAARFGQSWLGAILHPVGAAILLAIQWQARLRALRGQPTAWKGRTCPA